jgi:hypothetical protein
MYKNKPQRSGEDIKAAHEETTVTLDLFMGQTLGREWRDL